MKKKPIQHVYDFICMPLRLAFFPDSWSRRLGLTSLEDERMNAVLRHARGRLLDIGCGNNTLVKKHGNGVGVDVYKWSEDALIVPDTASLPFENGSFDTISFVACLNHIPNRKEVVEEAHRLLAGSGRVIVSMIDPVIGYIGHKIWWYGEDRERGMAPGETYGLWNGDIVAMFAESGFDLYLHERFVYKMNNLFVFKKRKKNA